VFFLLRQKLANLNAALAEMTSIVPQRPKAVKTRPFAETSISASWFVGELSSYP